MCNDLYNLFYIEIILPTIITTTLVCSKSLYLIPFIKIYIPNFLF